MAAKDKENEGEGSEAQAGVPQSPEVVVVSDGAPSTGSAAAPDVNDGLDRGEAAQTRADIAAEMRALNTELLDPVTNQPMSDFFPEVEGLDETSQALILSEMRASGVDVRAERLRRVQRGRQDAERVQEHAERNQKEVEKANPLPKQETVALDPHTYRARAHARVMAEAATLQSSTTIPGGMFVVNGEMVNCNGDLIDKSGNVLQKRSLSI